MRRDPSWMLCESAHASRRGEIAAAPAHASYAPAIAVNAECARNHAMAPLHLARQPFAIQVGRQHVAYICMSLAKDSS
jgi:hypothetical protein